MSVLTSGAVSGVVPVAVAATDNVAVSRVELAVSGAVVGTDTLAPFEFSWDTVSVGAVDAAGTASVGCADHGAVVARCGRSRRDVLRREGRTQLQSV